MKMKPIGDMVLIKPSAPESKTKGGIIIPDSAKETPLRGRVIAVGPGKEGLMTVQEDDWVLYRRYGGEEIELEGEKYIIMPESAIFLVVEAEE